MQWLIFMVMIVTLSTCHCIVYRSTHRRGSFVLTRLVDPIAKIFREGDRNMFVIREAWFLISQFVFDLRNNTRKHWKVHGAVGDGLYVCISFFRKWLQVFVFLLSCGFV